MKKIKSAAFIILAASMFTLVSCGGGSGGSSSKNDDTTTELQEDDDQGIYRAVLSPVNSKFVPNISGTIEVRIEGDELVAESTVAGAPVGVKHLQNVMEGSSCPTEANDSNADGIVDIVEGVTSFGKILIPLDSNLSDQMLGIDFGPIANAAGAYVYRRSSSFAALMADLNSDDPDKEDNIVKLSSSQTLSLSRRVVIVHGVGRQAELPETTSTIGEAAKDQLVPIACGKLIRVESEDTASLDDARSEAESARTTGRRIF